MPRNCAHCGQAFQPRPQVPNQSYCSSAECQRARKLRWQQDKLRTDPDYRDNQRDAQRAWFDRHPGYWRAYRAANPDAMEGGQNGSANLFESEIADRLNAKGIQTDLGRDWTRATVREVLSNEKYIGNNVYNRRSFKLKKHRVVNSPEMWIKKESAFEAIVPPELFYTAQGILRARSYRYSNDELIEKLRRLYQQRGYLSGLIIDEAEEMPSAAAYAHRFGGLIRAYRTVGFTPDRDYQYLEVNQFLRRLHPEIVGQTERMIAEVGGLVTRDAATDLLTVNHEFSVSLVLARCQILDNARRRWKVRFDTSLAPDITVAVRLEESNQAALDYYLLPRLDFGQARIHLADHNSIEFEAYHFDNLDYLYGMAERRSLRRIA